MRDLEKPPGNARIATALLDVLTAAGSAASRGRAERALENGPPRRRRSDWIATDRIRAAFRAAGVGPKLARRVGRELVAPEAIGLLLSYTGIATPEKAYRRCDALLAREEPGDRFHAAHIEEGRARIEFHPVKPSPNDALFCSLRLGMLEAMTPLYGLLPARVDEIECAHRGARACVYEVRWQRTPRTGLMWGALVGALLGGAAGVGLAVLGGMAEVWAVGIGMLVSLTAASAGRSIDLARQLDAVARGGLGQLALLDQADGVLAEKMDVLAKLEKAGATPAAPRTLGSTPLRAGGRNGRGERDDGARETPDLARRLHRPLASLQRALDELRGVLAAGAGERAGKSEQKPENPALDLVDECALAARDIQAVGADLVSSAGPVAVTHEPADLADIVRRGVAAVRPGQPATLDVRVSIECQPAVVRCQPFQLEQVVVQLVDNAAAAMNGKGTVQVELRTCPEGFELAVSDSGDGIDPEVLDGLFDPFFSPPDAEGAGLGLAICYRIVDQHGGELALHSEPGRGTRVAVVLPPCVGR